MPISEVARLDDTALLRQSSNSSVGVASLWAIAAALVPEMQKGKEWARTAHIGVNAVTFGLFAYYQIPTGLEIAAKVIEKTKFP